MMTGRRRLVAIAVAITATVALTTVASASIAGASDRDEDSFRIQLSGFQEVPLSLSSSFNGSFRIEIDERNQEIKYRLSYAGLEPATAVVNQAHIHIGQRAQNGGIVLFLCTNLGNGPAGTQACPASPGTITGTLGPADVIGPAGQGIAAGEWDEVVAAIRAGATYVNVHTNVFPAGEIRAQIDHHH